MNRLLCRLLLMTTCLVISTPAFAVTIDGFLSEDEYSNSFEAGWYNGHEPAGSQFQKDQKHITTGYYENTADKFFLYLEAPLEAKNMIWGSGFTEAEGLLYYEQWCQPLDGVNPENAQEGGDSSCGHHKDGFTAFMTKYRGSDGFHHMTHSEKVFFGIGTESDFAVKADLTGVVKIGYSDLTLTDYKDSVDWVIDEAICNLTDCSAYDIPMAFEFEFDFLTSTQISTLIAGIMVNEIEFHMSPERGAPSPVPEPATMLLLGTGLMGLAGFRRKLKR